MKKLISLFLLLCVSVCSCADLATNDTYHGMSTGINSALGGSNFEEHWFWLESKGWRVRLQYLNGKSYTEGEVIDQANYVVEVKVSKPSWLSSKTITVYGNDIQKVFSEVVEKVKKEL